MTDPIPTDQTTDPADPAGQGWQITAWLAALAVGVGGVVFFHDPARFAGGVGATIADLAAPHRAAVLWSFAGVGLLAALALVRVSRGRIRRQNVFHRRKALLAERALIRLRTEIWSACGDAREHDPGDAHTGELANAAREIARIGDALGTLGEAASQAAARAHDAVDAAGKGADAARAAAASVDDGRQRLDAAVAQLTQLSQSAREFQRAVELVRDATVDAGVVSLNVALQVGGGDDGNDAAAGAATMQQLADRAARAADTAAALARAVQRDADGVTDSLNAAVDAAAAPTDAAARAMEAVAAAARALAELAAQSADGLANESARAAAAGETMDALRLSGEQSAAKLSRVVAGIEKLKASGEPAKKFARRGS